MQAFINMLAFGVPLVTLGAFFLTVWLSGRTTEPKPDSVEVKPGAWWRAKTYRTADLPFDEDPPTDRPADPDKIYKTPEESGR